MSDLIRRQDVIEMLAVMQGRCDTKAALVQNSKIWQQVKDMPSAQPDIVRCKDCKYFERNYWDDVGGHPLIVGHDICTKWADGCKTSEDGFCFLGERREKKWAI